MNEFRDVMNINVEEITRKIEEKVTIFEIFFLFFQFFSFLNSVRNSILMRKSFILVRNSDEDFILVQNSDENRNVRARSAHSDTLRRSNDRELRFLLTDRVRILLFLMFFLL